MRDWLGSGGGGGGERAKQEWLRSSGGEERARQQRLGIALTSAAGEASAAEGRHKVAVAPPGEVVPQAGPVEVEDGGHLHGAASPATASIAAASRSTAKPFAVWQLHDGEWHRLSPDDGSWVRVAGGPMESHPAPTGPATQPHSFSLLPHSSDIGTPLPTLPGPTPIRSPQPATAEAPLLTPVLGQQGAPPSPHQHSEWAEAESVRVEGVKAAAIAAAVTAVAAPVAAGVVVQVCAQLCEVWGCVVVQVRDSSALPTLCRHSSPIHTFREPTCL